MQSTLLNQPAGQSAPISQVEQTAHAERVAAWLQFPRRVLLLLLAYGAALLILGALREFLSVAGQPGRIDWNISLTTHQPVASILADRMPVTLLLLAGALAIALLIALLFSLSAALFHRLEERPGLLLWPLQSVLRLSVLFLGALPVALLAICLLIGGVVQLKLFPAVPLPAQGSPGGSTEVLWHLLLPSFSLGLLPGILAGQAIVRNLSIPRAESGMRAWSTAYLSGLGVLFDQTGGMLGMTLVVDFVFALSSVARLVITGIFTRDNPILVAAVGVYALIILVGRLLAEFFHWLARLIEVPVPARPPIKDRSNARRRWIWVGLSIVLLLMPLTLLVGGLLTDPQAGTRQGIREALAGPSPQHPWGTDSLGRDIQARLLIGTSNALQTAAVVAVTVTVLGGLGGLLTGILARKASWVRESIADILLLPVDVMLLAPAVLAVMLIVFARALSSANLASANAERSTVLLAALIVVLLPRAVRASHAIWQTAPSTGRRWALGLGGFAMLLLGTMFAALLLIIAVDFLGLGILPPTPSLGSILNEVAIFSRTTTTALWFVALAMAIVPVFYIVADALLGLYPASKPLVRLLE